MKLEHLLTFTAEIGTNTSIGPGPLGTRAIAGVSGGIFEGPRLRGSIVGPGADWVMFDNTGHGQIDVRLIFQTDDGANIYVSYTGVLEMTEALSQAMASGRQTDFGDNYFVTHVRFETGAENHAWLNHVVAIGEGRGVAGGVQYRVHHCRPG